MLYTCYNLLYLLSSQLALAADLLADSADLRFGTPPLAAEATGLTASEVLECYPPRQVHYGHEDVMQQQFELPQHPPALTPPLVPKPRVAESEVAQRAAAEAAAEVAAEAVAVSESLAAQKPPQLARILFADGSSCSCALSCAAAHECCDDYPEACSGTAFSQ